MDIQTEMPELVRRYAMYQRNIKGRSGKTVEEYCLDLRTFFRFMMQYKKVVPSTVVLDEISLVDIDLDFIKTISTYDIFEFMNYSADERNNLSATRQRKTSSLKGFFTYLAVHEHVLQENPTENLSPPKKKKSLPKFLTLEQSIALLNAVDGTHKERDYCMLVLFLNCGVRLSELVGINITDVLRGASSLRVLGKGNKERMVYLNDACFSAIDAYLAVRPNDQLKDRNALFISARLSRISPKTVQYLVNTYLDKIGLGGAGYSVHKLRHTAATLMYQHGGTDIRVLQDILGHENLGTTQIYTHVSSVQMQEAAKNNPLARVLPKNSKK